jgi:hypothetical protein
MIESPLRSTIMARNKTIAVAKTPDPEPADKTLFDRVADFLTDRDWKYSSSREEGYFWLTLRLTDGSVKLVVDVAQSPDWQRVMAFSVLPVVVPQARRSAVSEALLRINHGQAFGSFDLDWRDGEVRARAVLESDSVISDPMIERAISKSQDLVDQYYAAILAIAFGNAAPDGVLEMASAPTERRCNEAPRARQSASTAGTLPDRIRHILNLAGRQQHLFVDPVVLVQIILPTLMVPVRGQQQLRRVGRLQTAAR